jgi:hypothetical protein
MVSETGFYGEQGVALGYARDLAGSTHPTAYRMGGREGPHNAGSGKKAVASVSSAKARVASRRAESGIIRLCQADRWLRASFPT